MSTASRTWPFRSLAVLQHIVWMALIFVSSVSSHRLWAEETIESTLPKIRTIFVPADTPSTWPPGNWRPIERKEYDRLIKSIQPLPPSPKTTWIDQAEYSATFTGQSLISGTANANVRHLDQHPKFLEFQSSNLPISSLRWSEKKAIWGTAPDGRTGVIVQKDHSELNFKWEFNGRRLSKTVVFDLRIPQATLSHLRIKVPQGYLLKTSAGDVKGPTTAEQAGWEFWSVSLGNRSEVRLIFRPIDQKKQSAPIIFADQTHAYTLSQDSLRLQAEFILEVSRAEINQLQLKLHPTLQIQSINYGNDTSLKWNSNTNPAVNQVTIDLPGPLVGRARPLRIQAIGPVTLDQKWTLPQLEISESLLRNSQIRLAVDHSLELKKVSTIGCRQIDVVTNPEQDSNLIFSQDRPDASITVILGLPATELSAHTYSVADLRGETWTMETRIHFQTQSKASLFTAECAIPTGWQVTDVQIFPHSEESSLLDWEIKSLPRKQKSLQVRFPEAIDKDHPRTIRITAERRSVTSNDLMDLPIARPLNCRSVAAYLSLSHPVEDRPVLQKPTTFDILTEKEILKALENIEFFDRPQSEENNTTLTFFSDDITTDEVFSLQRKQLPLSANASVEINLNNNNLTEEFFIHCTPSGESINQILVYLTSPGTSLQWEYVADQLVTLSAQKLQTAVHQELNLPLTGELWEINLHGPQNKPFRLRAKREKTFSLSSSPALAFVPLAKEFEGVIRLHTVGHRQITITDTGLHSVESSSSNSSSDKASNIQFKSTHGWNYDILPENLLFQISERIETEKHLRPAVFELKSMLFANDGRNDLHQANFVFNQSLTQFDFRFQLPESASLIETQIDGREVEALTVGNEYLLGASPGANIRSVSIKYSTPSMHGFFNVHYRIPVPSVSASITNFKWEFSLPKSYHPETSSDNFLINSPLHAANNNTRFLGPFARSPNRQFFNPFVISSWSETFGSDQELNPAARPMHKSANRLPAGWLTWHAHSLFVPQNLSLKVWNVNRIKLITWGIFLLILTIVILARNLNIEIRTSSVFCWLSTCLIAAWLAPTFVGDFFGAAFTALLLGIFLPKTLFQYNSKSQPIKKDFPLGSTQSYRNAGAPLAILICLSLLTSTSAQQSSSQPAKKTSSTSAAKQNSKMSFDILIPFSEDLTANKQSPVIYVSDSLYRHLHKQNLDKSLLPEYLIQHAEYRGTLNQHSIEDFSASYLVQILPSHTQIKSNLIYFPITNANLGGTSACIVDGKPHPVILKIGQVGFQIEIPRDQTQQIDKPQPITKSSFGNRVRNLNVQFLLHPVVNSEDGLNSLQIGIPELSSNQFSFETGQSISKLHVLKINHNPKSLPLAKLDRKIRFSNTDKLSITWSQNTDSTHDVKPGIANVLGLVNAHPMWFHYQYQINYDPQALPCNFLTVEIPQNAIFHPVDLRIADLLDYSVTPLNGQTSILLMEFSEPKRKPFSFELQFRQPISSQQDHFEIVPLRFLDNFSGITRKTQIKSLQMAISAAQGFQVFSQATASESSLLIETEDFLKKWTGPRPPRRPQLSFNIHKPGPLQIRFEPLTPKKQIRLTQIVHLDPRRLDWSATAEIETSTAPVFQHTVSIDPRLQLESASVKEENAERLVRTARSRDQKQLTLFLSGKTTGIQNVTLKGWLPVKQSETIVLPQTTFNQSEILESSLFLYKNNSLNISFPEAAHKPQLEFFSESLDSKQSGELLGRVNLLTSSQPLKLQIHDRQTDIETDSVTAIGVRNSDTLEVSTSFQLHLSPGIDQPIQLLIPPEFSEQFQIHAPDFQAQRVPQTDGSFIAVLTLTKRNSSKEFFPQVSVNALFSIPAEDNWQLPDIQVMGTIPGESYLLLSLPPSEKLVPADPSTSRIPTSTLPEWTRNSHAFELVASSLKAYRGTSPPWILEKPSPLEISPESSQVSLLENTIWIGSEFEYGHTHLTIAAASGGVLRLKTPPNFVVRSISLNQKLGLSFEQAPNSIQISIDFPSSTGYLDLYWQRKNSTPFPHIGEIQSSVLTPHEIPVFRSMVTVILPAKTNSVIDSGLRKINRVAYQINRVEGLFHLTHRQYEIDGFILEDTFTNALTEHSRLQQILLTTYPAPQSTPAAIKQRLEALQKDLRNLAQIDKKNGPASTALNLRKHQPHFLAIFFDQVPETENVLLALHIPTKKKRPFTLWVIEDAILISIVGAIGFTLILLISSRHSVIRLSSARHFPPALALMILGVFWWMLLSPSALGFAIFLYGTIAYFFPQTPIPITAESASTEQRHILPQS